MWGRRGYPSEPRLYALQPAHRWSGCAAAADRQGGHRPGPVVAARGLGPAGGLRTPHPAAQSGARFRRPRGLLLDQRLTLKASRNVQSRTEVLVSDTFALRAEFAGEDEFADRVIARPDHAVS